MLERRARVVRRVDVDALDLASELLLQGLERQQVVAEDEPVIEDVVARHALRSVIRLLRVFQQDARLQLRPILFADPGEFKLRFGHRKAHPRLMKKQSAKKLLILASDDRNAITSITG